MELSQTKGVVARATGDMSRLAIWQQMIHAIWDQPWFGYGWNQTSVAYTLVSEHFQGPVWIRSAHNFILDFVLWNGVIIAVRPFANFAQPNNMATFLLMALLANLYLYEEKKLFLECVF